jgi:large subunit ribosomal protein L19
MTDLARTDIKPGQTVRVHQKIKEGEKERLQVFEGLVIAQKHGKTQNATFTVRKTSEGVGVERIFPFGLPSIDKIVVVKRGVEGVKRAKLYYTRHKSPTEIEQIYKKAAIKMAVKEPIKAKKPAVAKKAKKDIKSK